MFIHLGFCLVVSRMVDVINRSDSYCFYLINCNWVDTNGLECKGNRKSFGKIGKRIFVRFRVRYSLIRESICQCEKEKSLIFE